ncbi:MAG: glycosyltransferase [Acaryochloridaceae cyanobacterium SU_2_1]|nr:glycosyltransferase [Acaryochloridaceae cyanobacterium SU_2_1]
MQTSWIDSWPENILNLYFVILLIIAIYSIHKFVIVWRYYRYRDQAPQPVEYFSTSDLPPITIQLPLFNEMYVVDRLLDAIAALDYPSEKLQIQVLDDSTDETQDLCRTKVESLQRDNHNIEYIHRPNRQGYKAGALSYGLQQTSSELVAIFDADFLPAPDALLNMVHYFTDPQIGMVQARWGHLNRNYSLFTEVQALMLDGHFVTEQTSRHRSACFFNFNGTAGIWRTKAIEDAGGWQHSTVTEDLDLSYRAQLRGWRAVYLPNIIVPAELPMEMNAFKSQQFRWAKGASQVAKKLLLRIFKAPIPFYVKCEAFFHLTNNFNYLLLLLLLLLSLPYQISLTHVTSGYGSLIHIPLFLVTTSSLLSFYWVSEFEQDRHPSFWQLTSSSLLLMGVGIGLSLNQSLAVCDGLFRAGKEFVRTPKHGVTRSDQTWSTKKYRAAKSWVPYLELSMLVYLLITLGVALVNQHYLSLPFLTLFVGGYLYVLAMGAFQRR